MCSYEQNLTTSLLASVAYIAIKPAIIERRKLLQVFVRMELTCFQLWWPSENLKWQVAPTAVASHQFDKANSVLLAQSLHMSCIYCPLCLLNSRVKPKWLVNNLPAILYMAPLNTHETWTNIKWCVGNLKKQKYLNVVIYGFWNANNSNLQTPPLDFLKNETSFEQILLYKRISFI